MADENIPDKKLYLVGEGDAQVAMPESEMVRRIEQWYDNLSERDQKKFRKRLWAPIKELGEQQNEQRAEARTEAGAAGALERPGPDAGDRPQPTSEAPAVTIGDYLRNEDRLIEQEAEALEEPNGEMYR